MFYRNGSIIRQLILLRLLAAGGGSSGQYVTVTGVSPLALVNSLAHAIKSLTQYGKVELRDPDVPEGWERVEYIESHGTEYITTPIKDVRNGTFYLDFAMTETPSTGFPTIWGAMPGNSDYKVVFGSGNQKLYNQLGGGAGFVNTVEKDLNRHKATVTTAVDNVSVDIDGEVFTGSYTITADTTYALSMFARNRYDGMNNFAKLKLYDAWHRNDVTGEIDYIAIPIKNKTTSEYALVDAVSGEILHNLGTGAFTGGAVVSPSPKHRMDLWTNNGVLRVKDDELPVGYRRLKDIIFDGEVYYVTNTYLTGADTTTCTINATENARNVLGCYTGSGSGNNISFYLNISGSGNYVRYKDALYRPVLNDGALGQDRTLSITPTGTTGFDTNATWSQLEFSCPDPLYIGWLANATSPKFLGTMKGNVTVSNRAKFIPCERQSDSEIGYYDLNSGTFLENQGTGTPTTSGYDDTHNSAVYADGTPEVLTVRGKNLFNSTMQQGGLYNNNGTESATEGRFRTGYIPVAPATTYALSWVKNVESTVEARYAYCYAADETYLGMTSSYLGESPVSFTTLANTAYMRMVWQGYPSDISNVQLELGSTATAYEPYHEPQTLTDIPTLLAVGDYKDAEEIIGGHADRAVTVFRVSPDLNWMLATGSGYKQFYTGDTPVPLKNSVSCMSNIAPYGCTASNRASYQHGCYTGGTGNLCFQMIGEADINTVPDWKDFLRANAVYVVAAKATETTEQTTPHALNSYNGTTIVDAQTNVDPVTLDAEYYASQAPGVGLGSSNPGTEPDQPGEDPGT